VFFSSKFTSKNNRVSRKISYNRNPVNSFRAMAVILWPLLGVHFFRGHISLKNWTICPLFSHDTSTFKDTCLLIYLMEAKVALYVFNVLINMPVPTYLMKRIVERQLGIESGSCSSA
jgi:nitrate reductase NapE component